MVKVIFLGFGNLNFHLAQALHTSGKVSVLQIYNRSPVELPQELANIPFTSILSHVVDADIYIVGIPDDAIADFSALLPFKNKLVVHTSGAVSMNKLNIKNRRGVFYPLQSFSKAKNVLFSKIPILVEAEIESDLEILKHLGETISSDISEISSEKRMKLHIAAVFVNNFTNYLYQIGSDILKKEDLPFDLLKPLIQETVEKLDHLSPLEAQTGPAKRRDLKSIQKHLDLLDSGIEKEIYDLMSKALIQKYHE